MYYLHRFSFEQQYAGSGALAPSFGINEGILSYNMSINVQCYGYITNSGTFSATVKAFSLAKVFGVTTLKDIVSKIYQLKAEEYFIFCSDLWDGYYYIDVVSINNPEQGLMAEITIIGKDTVNVLQENTIINLTTTIQIYSNYKDVVNQIQTKILDVLSKEIKTQTGKKIVIDIDADSVETWVIPSSAKKTNQIININNMSVREVLRQLCEAYCLFITTKLKTVIDEYGMASNVYVMQLVGKAHKIDPVLHSNNVTINSVSLSIDSIYQIKVKYSNSSKNYISTNDFAEFVKCFRIKFLSAKFPYDEDDLLAKDAFSQLGMPNDDDLTNPNGLRNLSYYEALYKSISGFKNIATQTEKENVSKILFNVSYSKFEEMIPLIEFNYNGGTEEEITIENSTGSVINLENNSFMFNIEHAQEIADFQLKLRQNLIYDLETKNYFEVYDDGKYQINLGLSINIDSDLNFETSSAIVSSCSLDLSENSFSVISTTLIQDDNLYGNPYIK